MTACSFASAKWPHWAGPGRTLLRVSVGRDGDERLAALDDAGLVERLHGELRAALGLAAGTVADTWRVNRWPGSFPQYRVGHAELVKRIYDEARRNLPGVTFCGSSYRGAGIPACIASGRAAARAVCSPRLAA